MGTSEETKTETCSTLAKIILTSAHTLVITFFSFIMIMELRLPFADFSPPTVNILMWVGASLWFVFMFDPLVRQTKRWAFAIYPMVVTMTLISFVAIFLDTINPLVYFVRWANAGISVVAFLVCSYRIKKSQMEYL